MWQVALLKLGAHWGSNRKTLRKGKQKNELNKKTPGKRSGGGLEKGREIGKTERNCHEEDFSRLGNSQGSGFRGELKVNEPSGKGCHHVSC